MRKSHSMRNAGYGALAILVAVLGNSSADAAESPELCIKRLTVRLTPDVPNPHDEGLLSSLLNNHPGYRLTWVRQEDLTTIVVDLSGPGPDEECDGVVETLRKDARVEWVRTDTGEIQAVSIHARSAIHTRSKPDYAPACS